MITTIYYYRSKIAQLESQLKGVTQERDDLDKFLKTSQESHRNQLKQLNITHNATITKITTPKKLQPGVSDKYLKPAISNEI